MTPAAIALIAVVVALVPICVARPWIGVLAYTWLSLMNPHRIIGDGVAYFSFAKVVAIATLIGLFFTRERYPLPRHKALGILAGFWVVCVASTVLSAQEPARAWADLDQFTKVVLMTMVGLVLFRGRGKITCWLAVIALSIGALGVIGSVHAVADGFRNYLYGPPSVMGDNNSLGFALTMALPLLAFLAIGTGRAWMRMLSLLVFGSTLVAVVATYSRGSFIVLCVVLPLVLWVLRSKALLVATACAALIVAALIPAQWEGRMATVTPMAYQNTRSGALRMKSWQVAWKVGLDHPLLGAGFRPFSPRLYERYLSGYPDYHDAHNHFLQVLAEHGFTGLLFFVASLAAVVSALWRTARASPVDPDREWTRPLAQVTLLSLLAYLVGGLFLNQPYFEPLYQVIAVAILLDAAAHRPIADPPDQRATPLAVHVAALLRPR